MKLLLTVVCLAVAVSAYEPINIDYHNTVGVYEAARIKQAEESTDFDGSRIVGGNFAILGQLPYQAGLLIRLQDGRQSVCGASLISNSRLVTAAHCWTSFGVDAREVLVVLGSITLYSGGTRILTNNVRPHERFNPFTLQNDIAIIYINPVSYSNNIRNIEIASGNDQYVGSWATAAGFGRYTDTSGASSTLRYARLQVISNDACKRTYGNIILSSFLCVSTRYGESTCAGDSGGPLVINNTLIGVTCFGHSAGCSRGHPAGFQRVTSFYDWIVSNM
ncbi:collagenase-like [Danaus plexippus]|uniref:collagenase-like n=1 Tax=Danaus plexippus TaxID=13037 RepID=UPI002AB29F78|nr:collagenase-like [Danaus plexippus]